MPLGIAVVSGIAIFCLSQAQPGPPQIFRRHRQYRLPSTVDGKPESGQKTDLRAIDGAGRATVKLPGPPRCGRAPHHAGRPHTAEIRHAHKGQLGDYSAVKRDQGNQVPNPELDMRVYGAEIARTVWGNPSIRNLYKDRVAKPDQYGPGPVLKTRGLRHSGK